MDIFSDSEFRDLLISRHGMEWSWGKLFPAVLPLPVVLNPNESAVPRWDPLKNSLVDDTTPATGFYVPFKEALVQFLSIDDVYNAVLESFSRNSAPRPEENRRYSDIWDGDFVRQNKTFIENNGAVLGIQLYHDDVEPANPLGSKKGKHKQAVFYWTLMNLPPQCRSTLRSIQVVAIAKSSYLREHGPDFLLKPFLDSMREFQTGVSLKIRGEVKTWHAILINVVGDMLASSFLGGFKEGVGRAFRPCRICYIQRNKLDSCHHEASCSLRDKNSHAAQVASIMDESNSPQTKKDLSKQHGIVRDCCLNVLEDFDPIKQFPHDLMHVLYEGVLNLECRFVLRKLIIDGLVDIAAVNRELSSLKSCREFTTPPPLILKQILDGSALSYSSSEMQSLCILLPLILGKYCSCLNNPYYANFILLLRITASLQCYSFNEDELEHMAYLIKLHNSSFVILYPSLSDWPSITPKLHALLHLIRQIILFGALRYSWAFSYEAKNAPFKRIMRSICNFKNVSYTLILSYQRLTALYRESNGQNNFFGIDRSDVKIIRLTRTELATTRAWFNKISADLLIQNINASSRISIIDSCKVSGRLCKKGAAFVKILPNEQSLPVFWRIDDMFVFENQNFVVLETLFTSEFDLDKFSFLVTPANTFTVMLFSSLIYSIPLHSFELNNGIHIVPNYYHLL